jgi:signal transduction histidine kinase
MICLYNNRMIFREWTVARRILVVEDNLDLADLLVMHLCDAGYAVQQASDFTRTPSLAEFDTDSQDEPGRLGRTFKSMAEHIAAQVGMLKQVDALRRELLANVSHDLRTPIASLQGYLETLQMKADTLSAGERNQYLQIAMRHSERLGKLVAELFELAKLESGYTQLHREAFALGELVQDVVL